MVLYGKFKVYQEGLLVNCWGFFQNHAFGLSRLYQSNGSAQHAKFQEKEKIMKNILLCTWGGEGLKG